VRATGQARRFLSVTTNTVYINFLFVPVPYINKKITLLHFREYVSTNFADYISVLWGPLSDLH
jgi:hypothetical protein